MERIEKLKQFLESNPGDAFVQHALGLEYVKLGDDEQAEKLFRNLLEQEAGYTGTYYHLAMLLERVGKKDEARVIYEKGIEACKKSGDTHALRELQNAYDDLMF